MPLAPRDFADVFGAHRAAFGARRGHDHDQGGRGLIERFELLGRLNFDNVDARHANGVIVHIARVLRNDDFIFHAVKFRHALHLLGIAPAMQADVAWVSAAAQPAVTMPQSALVSSASRWLPAVHQLVQMDVMARGFVHRVLHFGQRLRAA